jgi:hypothetical protein
VHEPNDPVPHLSVSRPYLLARIMPGAASTEDARILRETASCRSAMLARIQWEDVSAGRPPDVQHGQDLYENWRLKPDKKAVRPQRGLSHGFPLLCHCAMSGLCWSEDPCCSTSVHLRVRLQCPAERVCWRNSRAEERVWTTSLSPPHHSPAEVVVSSASHRRHPPCGAVGARGAAIVSLPISTPHVLVK